MIYESLVACRRSATNRPGRGSRSCCAISTKVQIAAIETVGLLRTQEAVPALGDVLKRPKNDKVRRAALDALAMLPDEKSRPIYQQYLNDKDDKLRAAAAEGFGAAAESGGLAHAGEGVEGRRQTAGPAFRWRSRW